MNVLVVDDNPGFRQVAHALLNARGIRVVAECADGASALAAVSAYEPDGVLLDVHLPDQDGMSVARILREGPHPPRVVLTSTDRSPWSGEELSAAGVTAFVPKELLHDTDLAGLLSP